MRWLITLLLVVTICEAQVVTIRRAGRWNTGPPPPPPRAKTYRGATFGHADSASTAGPGPQTISPYDSVNMAAGDLCVLIGWNRTPAGYPILSATGGKTWDSTAPGVNAVANSARIMWCKFDGTWDERPSMKSPSGTTALTVGMWTFRPADGNAHTFAYDGTQDTSRYAAPSADSLATLTGKTPTVDSCVVFGFFMSNDDNAWAAGTAGWADGTTDNGVKNVSGSDISGDLVYLIQTAKGASGNVARKQIARGADAGGKAIFVIK